ncbi:MAG: hypothetical protein HY721_31110 [Planctomycetes bacterium]|nr:hypothetical protein [Planctomycetota bacterium]
MAMILTGCHGTLPLTGTPGPQGNGVSTPTSTTESVLQVQESEWCLVRAGDPFVVEPAKAALTRLIGRACVHEVAMESFSRSLNAAGRQSLHRLLTAPEGSRRFFREQDLPLRKDRAKLYFLVVGASESSLSPAAFCELHEVTATHARSTGGEDCILRPASGYDPAAAGAGKPIGGSSFHLTVVAFDAALDAAIAAKTLESAVTSGWGSNGARVRRGEVEATLRRETSAAVSVWLEAQFGSFAEHHAKARESLLLEMIAGIRRLDSAKAARAWLEAEVARWKRLSVDETLLADRLDAECWSSLETLAALEPCDGSLEAMAARYDALAEHFSDGICIRLARERAAGCRSQTRSVAGGGR